MIKFWGGTNRSISEKEKYKEMYAGKIGEHYKEFHKLDGYGRGNWGKGIISYVKTINPKSILDVGCGFGNFCNDMTEFVETVYGCDIGSVATGNIIKNEKIKFINCEAKSIPLENNSIEWITSFDCLEHCLPEDIDAILDEFNRIATKGFIFSISYTYDGHNGLDLHMTVKPEKWWIEKISKYGEIKREGIIEEVKYPYIVCIKK